MPSFRRPSRPRRWAKWFGLGACVILVSTWLFSAIVWMEWQRPGATSPPRILLSAGCIRWSSYLSEPPHSALGFRASWPTIGHSIADELGLCLFHFDSTLVIVPLWPFIVFTMTIASVLWWHDRRPPRGHCQACGYDLTGNESGTCPECGTSVGEAAA